MMSKTKSNGKAILIDISKCTGCESCVNACVEKNRLDPVLSVANAKTDGLSGNRFTALVQLASERFAKISCTGSFFFNAQKKSEHIYERLYRLRLDHVSVFYPE